MKYSKRKAKKLAKKQEKKNQLVGNKEYGIEDLEITRFLERPSYWTFKKIIKSKQTLELVDIALKHDGFCIKDVAKRLLKYDMCVQAIIQNPMAITYVPEKYRDRALYELAIKNNGRALCYTPEEYFSKELFLTAVKSNGCALEFVPKEERTEELCLIALSKNPSALKYVPNKFIDTNLVCEMLENNGLLLGCVPKVKRSKKIVEIAIKNNAKAFEYVPERYLNDHYICKLLDINEKIFEYIPEEYITEDICNKVFHDDPTSMNHIPDEYITLEMCIECANQFFDKESNLKFSAIPYELRNNRELLDIIINNRGAQCILNWFNNRCEFLEVDEEQPLSNDTVSYLKSRLYDKTYHQSILKPALTAEETYNHSDLALECNQSMPIAEIREYNEEGIYYISDIHLEFQLQELASKEYFDDFAVVKFIDEKIKNMIADIDTQNKILLVAGDVAHSVELTELFFERLNKRWHGTLFYVLGNHELWNNHIDGVYEKKKPSIEEIVNLYRKAIQNDYDSNILLQNELYLDYKNQKGMIIDEKRLNKCSDKELQGLCNESALIILGGIDFSGLNPKYNAEKGIYRGAIQTLKQDQRRSEEFYKIYKKVERCAENQKVIVLTHMPYQDWCNERLNDNWIYVHGHTHINNRQRENNGAAIYADNQIGYKPKQWELKEIAYNKFYDPLKDYEDGIHCISKSLYREFYFGLGIDSSGCNRDGKIYALKNNNVYMFILQTNKGLYILSGGQIKRLEENDLNYYYEHMYIYYLKVVELMEPYHNYIKQISNEVLLFGGSGKIHGCIVDVDYFNHIYVNPYDGSISYYYAVDVLSRLPYKNLLEMLTQNPNSSMLNKYITLSEQKKLMYLGIQKKKRRKEQMEISKNSSLLFGTEIYKPSNIMKKIQFIFDNHLIRIWNDDILSYGEKNLIE